MCIRDRVRDTSKKIKAVKRSKGMSGKPVTSKPVYGYLMDEDENFIIDEMCIRDRTRAAEESGSFLEQDSTTVPKSAYLRFCPLW